MLSLGKLIWLLIITVTWVGGFFVAAHCWQPAIWLIPSVLVVLIVAAVWDYRVSGSSLVTKILPVSGDYLRARTRREHIRGNDTLRALGLVKETDRRRYKAYRTKFNKDGISVLTVDARLAILSKASTVKDIVENHLAAVPAAAVDIVRLGVGNYRMTFYAHEKPDYLDGSRPADLPTDWND